MWARGVWKDGYWTLMLKRKLNTGSGNDVVFEPGRSITMSLAVYDNAGDNNKYASLAPLRLTLAR
ncbi:ethylbenzene dehydrogenase-related protein [Meiothermus rufus]|uniref:ethylbenzene dehydrogenase-related protein n=1 Tax=Meiothermus rufus TaxID=604332 RepID=UPI00316AE4C4